MSPCFTVPLLGSLVLKGFFAVKKEGKGGFSSWTLMVILEWKEMVAQLSSQLHSAPGSSLQEVCVSWWPRFPPLSPTSVRGSLQGPYSSRYLPSPKGCFPDRAIQSSFWTCCQRWSSILFPSPISQSHSSCMCLTVPLCVSEQAKGTEPVLCDSSGH